MSPPFNVLFICTANACRSQMAEAILRHVGGDRFVARSAGASPIGQIHPLASTALALADIPLQNQYSKGFEEVLEIEHDLIITLCDSAACLTPSAWAGRPVIAHWSLFDPVSYPGTGQEQIAVARGTAAKLRAWIEQLVDLPLEDLTPEEIRAELLRIAQT